MKQIDEQMRWELNAWRRIAREGKFLINFSEKSLQQHQHMQRTHDDDDDGRFSLCLENVLMKNAMCFTQGKTTLNYFNLIQ